MNQDIELQDLMRSIGDKSLRVLSQFKIEPNDMSQLIEQFQHLTADYQILLSKLFTHPEQLINMQLSFWQDSVNLMQNQFNLWIEGKPLPVEDKRFSSEEWLHHPLFNLLSHQYVLASQHINTLLSKINYGDEHVAKRVTFFSRQFLDALSPDNFLFTNPQLMQETLQSHGKNLLIGLEHLLTDLAENPTHPMISMTDKSVFALGKNIAVTKGSVIYKNELMELIQYCPQTTQVKSVPLLIIPPWINKYYILDLSPQKSFVQWLVSQGITVFMISWVNPDKRYAQKSLYDYLHEGPMTAIDVIQQQLHIPQVNTLGFCIGGTLLSMLLAYDKALQNERIRSATFLASLIDFSDTGDINVFIDEQQIEQLETQMQDKGYLEGRLMTNTFTMLRSRDLIWSFFIKNYLQGQSPVPFDILYWNSDATNMPATMHSQYLRWMYLNNDLIKPNQIKLNNIPLNIKAITTPAYFISTQKDHIAPWKTTYAGFQAFSGKKQFLLGGSGHIAGIIIPPGSEKYGYYVNSKHPKDPDEWLNHATHHAGSWWPEWFSWLQKKSGRLISAPVSTQLPHPPIMEAPGQYVLSKAK